GFEHSLFLGPLPELRCLLAVMRHALKLSVFTGRRNIGWHKAPPTMIAPTEQTWRCGGSRRSTVYLALALLHVNREASVCLVRQKQSGRSPARAPTRMAPLGGLATGWDCPTKSSG